MDLDNLGNNLIASQIKKPQPYIQILKQESLSLPFDKRKVNGIFEAAKWTPALP
jgi:hypothetical protein